MTGPETSAKILPRSVGTTPGTPASESSTPFRRYPKIATPEGADWPADTATAADPIRMDKAPVVIRFCPPTVAVDVVVLVEAVEGGPDAVGVLGGEVDVVGGEDAVVVSDGVEVVVVAGGVELEVVLLVGAAATVSGPEAVLPE